MKSFFDDNPIVFRLAVVLLGIPLLWLAANNTYNLVNVGHDEHFFQTSQSRFYISRSVPVERLLRANHRFFTFAAKTPSEIRVGDLLVAINREKITTYTDVERALAAATDGDIVVDIQRPTRNNYFLQFQVTKEALEDNFLWEIPPTVYVWDIVPGGASYRAGMKPGDLIHRINGKTFKNSREADSLVKSTLRGQTVDYGIIRQGRFSTVKVIMARLTIPHSLIFFELVGFLWVICGLTLVWFRPYLKAARLVGSGIFLIGISFLLYENRSDQFSVLFPESYRILSWMTLYLGMACLLHGSYYFPRDNTAILHRSAMRHQVYPLAIIGAVLTHWTGLNGLLFGFTLLLAPQIWIRYRYRNALPKEQGRLERYILLGAMLGITAMVVWSFMRDYAPQSWDWTIRGSTAALVLLAYLLTIGRFRLLGIEITRSLQFSVVSTLWLALLIVSFILVLNGLTRSEINLLNVQFTRSNIEFHGDALSDEQKQRNHKLTLMIFSLSFGYVFLRIGRNGQRFLRRKYFRTSYDFMETSGKLTDLWASRLSLTDLAQGLVENLAKLMLLRRVGVMFFKDAETVASVEVYGFKGETWKPFYRNKGPQIARTLKLSSTELCVDYMSSEIREKLSQDGFQYIYPMNAKDELVGCLMVGEKLSETTFKTEDFRFLSATANHAAVAVENAFLYERLARQERLEYEMDLARHIQVSSLPQTEPQIQGLSISATSVPASEVGGDYYAYFPEASQDLTVIVADVSGKGTSAALYMSKMQGIFSSLHHPELGPRDLLLRVNPILFREMDRNAFVTAICARFDMTRRRLSFARAGHLPLIAYRAATASTHTYLPGGLGLAVEDRGLLGNLLKEETLDFQTGDVFLFITDGITETLDTQGKIYGETRVLEILERHAEEEANQIRDAILHELADFGYGQDQHDDQTIVIVKIGKEP